MTTLPHFTSADWPELSAGRFAAGIRRDSPKECAIALVGLPDDLGIRLNNGRVGAAMGPRAFRAALARYGTGFDGHTGMDLSHVGVFDAGDVVPVPGADEAALIATHERVTSALSAIHRMGLIPVCIGGGHDLTYPTVRALAQHTGSSVGGINLDAHLDVRASTGSGMPFRSLIEGGHLDPKRFVTLGAGRFSNLREHVEYLSSKRASIAYIDEALSGRFGARESFDRVFGSSADEAISGFISVDLDAIDGSQAPGVSAVNPMGLSVEFACDIARHAGTYPGVMHFDIMELSPPHDDPAWNPSTTNAVGRTARVAALLFLSFVAGFAERGS